MASLNDRFSQVAEAFAGIRSLIDSLAGPKLGRSVLVVSTTAAEGKTITACNLAIMTAKRGLKTLLVDFDLRRPRVGRMFNVAPVRKPDACPEPAGWQKNSKSCRRPPRARTCSSPAGPPEISARPKSWAPAYRAGLHEMGPEARYDRVIVDSPPYGIVSDAVSLAGLTGCLVMVCRPNKSRKRATRHAIKRLAEAGANIAGRGGQRCRFPQGRHAEQLQLRDTHYNYRDEVRRRRTPRSEYGSVWAPPPYRAFVGRPAPVRT
jgi:Mrp family chromosome partitioning ATPase